MIGILTGYKTESGQCLCTDCFADQKVKKKLYTNTKDEPITTCDECNAVIPVLYCWADIQGLWEDFTSGLIYRELNKESTFNLVDYYWDELVDLIKQDPEAVLAELHQAYELRGRIK